MEIFRGNTRDVRTGLEYDYLAGHHRPRAQPSDPMDPIEPHFFGSSDRRLFGVYHVPEGRFRSHGVVLCPPGPQRYMRSHMALRQVAMTLAGRGFHVLRFDYYGTGDSAGASDEGNLSEWKANIVSAADDLRECSGARRLSLIGFRLGATLAAAVPLDLADLILWDPVVTGGEYIRELRSLHRRQFAGVLFPPRLPRPGVDGDVLGLPFPAQLQTELATLDLRQVFAARPDHVALVVSDGRQDYTRLRADLERLSGGAVDFRHLPAEVEADQQEAMLVSTTLLESIASVLTRRAS